MNVKWSLIPALWACDDGSIGGVDASIDATVDIGDATDGSPPAASWPCPRGWVRAADEATCEPDARAECPPGIDEACVQWPCPSGWSRAAEGEPCRPPGAEGCGAGRFAHPGGCSAPWPCPEGWSRHELLALGCFAPPDACPRGTHSPWTGPCDDLGHTDAACGRLDVAAGAVHVDAAAAPGGDGTARRPFATLADALRSAPPRATLALAAGVYRAERVVETTLLGGCAAQVEITLGAIGADTSLEGVTLAVPEAPTAVEPGADVTLRSVRIIGDATGLDLGPGATLVAEALAVRAGTNSVRVAEGAEFECTRCALEGPEASIEGFQQGIECNGGEVRLRHTTLRHLDRGVTGNRGCDLELRDVRAVDCFMAVVVSEAEADISRFAADSGFFGIRVFEGGVLKLREASFVGNGFSDLSTLGRVEASRLSTDGTLPNDGADSGRQSILVGPGATAAVTQFVAFEAGTDALFVWNGGDATVTDLRIDGAGFGGNAQRGRLEIVGAAITRTAVGVNAQTTPAGPDALEVGRATLRDVVLGPGRPLTGHFWVGAFVDSDVPDQPSRMALHDVHVRFGPEPAVGVAILQGRLRATRLVTVASGPQRQRTAVAIAEGGHATIEAATLQSPRAVTATRRSRAELADVEVDNRAWPIDAIDVVEGSELSARRLTVLGDGGPPLVVQGVDSRAVLRGLRAHRAGNIAAIDGASLELRDAILEAPVGGGVALAGAGVTAQLDGLWVRGGGPAFLGPRFAAVAASAGAAASLVDVTVEGSFGGTGVFALLAQLELERVAVLDTQGDGAAEGLRLDATTATGTDLLLRGMNGPGLVVIESDIEVARAAVLDNEIGILRQGESRLRLDPSRVEGNRSTDEVCDQCSEAPPEIAPPTPLPPL